MLSPCFWQKKPRLPGTKLLAAVCLISYKSWGGSLCMVTFDFFSSKRANRLVSTRTWPRSNLRNWPNSRDPVFFFITMAGCLCVDYQGKTWHLNLLLEEVELGKSVWCFGQCCAMKPWIMPSMWMFPWHLPPFQALLELMY